MMFFNSLHLALSQQYDTVLGSILDKPLSTNPRKPPTSWMTNEMK